MLILTTLVKLRRQREGMVEINITLRQPERKAGADNGLLELSAVLDCSLYRGEPNRLLLMNEKL